MAGFKVIVSDLHLGAGFAESGNPLEDFDRDAELAGLLAHLVAESERDQADVELFFNGDSFEMLQVPHVDRFEPERPYPAHLYHSTAEPDSARKMALIVAGHPAFFAALRDFFQEGPPRRTATFVKGNHDVDLYWPAVQERIREAVGATGHRRSLLAFEERLVCRDGLYVEHGNQYAESLSRLADMAAPVDPDRPGELALPRGSWLVMDVFNTIERERFWIDGVKPVTALVWYALAFDFRFAAQALVTLLRAMPGVIQEGFLGLPGPQADLLRQFQDAAHVDEIAARYEGDERFRTWLNAEVAQVLEPAPATTPGAEVEVPAEGAAAAAALPSMANAMAAGDREREQVRSALYEAAARRAEETGAAVVTFGHTHEAGLEALPNGGVYANTGTWTWWANLTGADRSTWEKLFSQPEAFMDDHWLTYLRVDYDEAGRPVAQLLNWDGGTGGEVAPVTTPSWWARIWGWLRGLWRQLLDRRR